MNTERISTKDLTVGGSRIYLGIGHPFLNENMIRTGSKTLIVLQEQKIYKLSSVNKSWKKKASPAAIASSSISLKRCESSLGSEQSIEQNSL